MTKKISSRYSLRRCWILALCPAIVAVATYAQSSARAPLAGEIGLRGTVQTINRGQGSFVLKVSAFSLSNGRIAQLRVAKEKTVIVTRTTRFSSSNNSSPSSFSRLTPGKALTVVGQDAGTGQPLSARIIILTPSPIARLSPRAGGTIVPSPRPASGRLSGSSAPTGMRVQSFSVPVGSGRLRGQMLSVSLKQVRLKVGIARDQVGQTEPLAEMARRYGAVAAINGSYFQAYNRGAYKPPVMNLITGGQLLYQGPIGTMLGFTADNRVVMDRSDQVASLLRGGTQSNSSLTLQNNIWFQVQEAMGCGPRLLQHGTVRVESRAEGFNDPKVLSLSTARSAVGVTRDNQLVLVVTTGTIPQLAGAMKALGCEEAMNLDGGASSGLWVRGKFLRSPGRALSNSLLILPR